MATVTVHREDGLAGAVALAAAGDEVAFARIVEAHNDDMIRVCFVICGDLDIADEAVQAAWPIVWRKVGSLRDPSRLRPWLVSIAANEARLLIRRRRRRAVVELGVADAAASDVDPAGRVADLDLTNALARLDPDDRMLLALRYVAGFDSTELARATGRSPSGTGPDWLVSSPVSERSSVMTDRLDFEARLEDRLRARAAIATRPFDAAAIAHQAALAGGRRRLGGTLRLTNWSRLRSAAVGLLVLGLVAAGIAAGSRLLQREAPVSSDSPISTTTPVLPSATPQASVVPVAGRIVYTRWKTLRDGEEDCTALFCHRASVNIANDDGSNEQELVPGPYAYLLAASPAGPTVLVRRRDADGDHAYLTDVSGSPLQRLETDCRAPCGEDWYGFTFSPDGTRLAWVRSLTDERPVIAIMDMSTGVVVQLASTLDIASRPGWSPDGSRLVFANQIVDADGGNLHQFAPNDLFRGMEGEFAVSLAAPQWSPDGSLIAFVVLPRQAHHRQLAAAQRHLRRASRWDGPAAPDHRHARTAPGGRDRRLWRRLPDLDPRRTHHLQPLPNAAGSPVRALGHGP